MNAYPFFKDLAAHTASLLLPSLRAAKARAHILVEALRRWRKPYCQPTYVDSTDAEPVPESEPGSGIRF